MNNLGEPLTEAELTAMIAEADTDGDGKINFEEFKNLMANKAVQNVIIPTNTYILIEMYTFSIYNLHFIYSI